MFTTRSGAGSRGVVSTNASGGKEIVIIPSSQVSNQAVKFTGKMPNAAPSATATAHGGHYIAGQEVITPPTRITVTSGGKIMTLTPGPVKTASGALKRPLEYDFSMNIRKFPRSTDKSKGLRHFSTKVCDKVREKGVTNYNEVADELVQEYFESMPNPPSSQEKQIYDQKNIRRRVYDALNVLMAMNIISKEKKEIRWIGLPTSSVQECKKLEEEKIRRMERIYQKTENLKDMIIQLVAFKSLVERNKNLEKTQGKPLPNTVLQLPYIIVNTDKRTEVDCSISSDKTEYLFKFNQPFEIHDDNEVLRRLGFARGLDIGQVKPDEIKKLKSFLPPALRDYVDQIASGKFMTKYMPPSMMARNLPALNFTRAIDRYVDKTRSMDAADLEVAMTLSSTSTAPPHLAAAPFGTHHSYYHGNVMEDGEVHHGVADAQAPENLRETPSDRDDDDDRSDFSDMESLESESNQGY